MERRAVERERMDIDESRLIIKYRIPLNEIILDFHETLKSISSGFAAYEYEEDGYEPTHVVRLDFTVNGHLVRIMGAGGGGGCRRLWSLLVVYYHEHSRRMKRRICRSCRSRSVCLILFSQSFRSARVNCNDFRT